MCWIVLQPYCSFYKQFFLHEVFLLSTGTLSIPEKKVMDIYKPGIASVLNEDICSYSYGGGDTSILV